MRICIVGAGAIGSQIAWHIAGEQHEMMVLDDDTIESHNVTTGTSMYSIHHIGMFKSVALAEMLWRKIECRCEPVVETLLDDNIIQQWNPDLVIDGFDNVAARGITHETGFDTVHVGVSEARTGEVMWDEWYQLPVVECERGENPICTHHLGRQILRFTASVAAGVIERWMMTGEKVNLVVTERMDILVLK